MNFTTDDLETILYSLEGYIQGNDDNELVEKLDGICYRIQRQIEVQSATQYNTISGRSYQELPEIV